MRGASSIPYPQTPSFPCPKTGPHLFYCFTGLVHPGLILGSMNPSSLRRTW